MIKQYKTNLSKKFDELLLYGISGFVPAKEKALQSLDISGQCLADIADLKLRFGSETFMHATAYATAMPLLCHCYATAMPLLILKSAIRQCVSL